MSGALIDVLQGHDVFMLDPGESEDHHERYGI